MKYLLTLAFLLSLTANAQTPGAQFNNYSFNYLTAVLNSANMVNAKSANAFNSRFLPKYYSLSITGTSTGWVVVLDGSLDNSNWAPLAVTNTTTGVISSSSVQPMLYLRLRATTVSAGNSITATAVGVP